jgi:hypothetical protein
MLGNPEAHIRRALVVNQQGDDYVVDKVGFGEDAGQSVRSELEVIKVLPNHLTGIPVLHGEHKGDNWISYSTSFVEGSSPGRGDDEQVISVLEDWMRDARVMPLSDTRQWQEMSEYASRNNLSTEWIRLQNAGLMKLKTGVIHGDFAPWNIKLSSVGEVMVLDWETGYNEGPAGWDWLHYMIQRATLVDNLTADDALKLCRTWGESKRGAKFLNNTGWGGQIELWIGTYLVYSSWIAGFDRAELFAAWMAGLSKEV